MAPLRPGAAAHDLYRLLAVARDASAEDITRAFRRQARAVHPDSRPGDASAAARFRALAEAYHVLSDAGRRARYDRELRRLPGAAAPRPPAVRARGPEARPRYPGMPGSAAPPGAALWAGPVRVEPPASPPPAAGREAAPAVFPPVADTRQPVHADPPVFACPATASRYDASLALAILASLLGRHLDDGWADAW